jgi:hypothetical protein
MYVNSPPITCRRSQGSHYKSCQQLRSTVAVRADHSDKSCTYIQHFVVVLVDSHLEIQAGELAQVSKNTSQTISSENQNAMYRLGVVVYL